MINLVNFYTVLKFETPENVIFNLQLLTGLNEKMWSTLGVR